MRDMLVDPEESPLDALMQAEVKERVAAALGRVAEPFRTTLILREIEGFGYEEIAEIVGVNLGTVKSRLVRGRALLKNELMVQVAVTQQEPEAGCESLYPAPAFEEAQ